MLVYMTHAKHGRMPCYTPQEVQYNQKHGWEIETHEKVEIQAEKRKPGRPKKVEDGNRV